MRPDHATYFIRMAALVATRATCLRRAVGAVLVNSRRHVLATGYNGVAAGRPHCNHHDMFEPVGYPHACQGATAPSGQKLDECEAIHAEQNALLQCRNVFDIDTCYVTVSPCIHCVKLLLNTSCKRIVTPALYDQRAATLWTDSGRELVIIPDAITQVQMELDI
ncbi:MAG: deoxycytidylate deaminase [Candidatus Accumulibacter vicinus]|uniref:Deoxycytidylate deaminase n=1 Tax=Candidatus Accumulibacter vicinus TaxID=2954382 RepID=A0A084XUC6_9PROT|nr:MAG: deoxycytidylate deaminase [Candidatus Accumulibacter vicinus]